VHTKFVYTIAVFPLIISGIINKIKTKSFKFNFNIR